MKKMLENQQKVNEAVKAITNYFEDSPYETDLELMLDATTQIVGLMDLKMLRPFAMMADGKEVEV